MKGDCHRLHRLLIVCLALTFPIPKAFGTGGRWKVCGKLSIVRPYADMETFIKEIIKISYSPIPLFHHSPIPSRHPSKLPPPKAQD